MPAKPDRVAHCDTIKGRKEDGMLFGFAAGGESIMEDAK
jgi:hypothetical protein